MRLGAVLVGAGDEVDVGAWLVRSNAVDELWKR
jgi:hypothetical protein